jgi:hypothetical protein
MKLFLRILPLIPLLALPAAALAGTETGVTETGKAVQPVECVPVPQTTILDTSDYGFHQDMKRGSGNLEVTHNNFELDERIPLNITAWPNVQCGQWYVSVGADYERFDFSIHNEGRLPGTLQSASGVLALEYVVNDQTAFVIETRPGVYFERKVSGGSFDAPTDASVVIPISKDKVYLVAGFIVSGLGRYPILPIGGLLWHINEKWDLRAYLPDPRLVYEVSDKLELYAGGELVGGAYKTDNRSVDPEKLSGATVTYDEVRAGAGVTWKLKPFTLDFAGGYTVQSEFDYNRAGESFSTHPAPYVRLTARVDF